MVTIEKPSEAVPLLRITQPNEVWQTAQLVAKVETFGAVVRRLRERKGLTQLELALNVGLSEKTIQALETSQDRPRLKNEVEVVRKMAEALDVPTLVLSESLGWALLTELRSPDWETVIWADKRFSEEDRQMMIRVGRLALSEKR